MTAFIVAALASGALAATWQGASPDATKRLEALGGSLLATGFLLLGAGLRLVVLISRT